MTRGGSLSGLTEGRRPRNSTVSSSRASSASWSSRSSPTSSFGSGVRGSLDLPVYKTSAIITQIDVPGVEIEHVSHVAHLRPRRTLIALFAFLLGLALLIHFILLSTDRFNWLEGPRQPREDFADRNAGYAHGLAGPALALTRYDNRERDGSSVPFISLTAEAADLAETLNKGT